VPMIVSRCSGGHRGTNASVQTNGLPIHSISGGEKVSSSSGWTPEMLLARVAVPEPVEEPVWEPQQTSPK
jgi:hypothetical protein